MKYVLICPSFYEMIADGGLFVFLAGFSILTEQNTKLTTLLSLPNIFFFCGEVGGLFKFIEFRSHRVSKLD